MIVAISDTSTGHESATDNKMCASQCDGNSDILNETFGNVMTTHGAIGAAAVVATTMAVVVTMVVSMAATAGMVAMVATAMRRW